MQVAATDPSVMEALRIEKPPVWGGGGGGLEGEGGGHWGQGNGVSMFRTDKDRDLGHS